MAGAGIEVAMDRGFAEIAEALLRASRPKRRELYNFLGEELAVISADAFENEQDPSTGRQWDALRSPRADGSTSPALDDTSRLRLSLTRELLADGVIFGSNVVYAGIQQSGGKTQAHDIAPRNAQALRFNGRFAKKAKHPGSNIPARPYLGVPPGFERDILNDEAVLRLLGLDGILP
jgi:phage gpG-like protein